MESGHLHVRLAGEGFGRLGRGPVTLMFVKRQEMKKGRGQTRKERGTDCFVPARKRIKQSRYTGTLPDHITPLCLPA